MTLTTEETNVVLTQEEIPGETPESTETQGNAQKSPAHEDEVTITIGDETSPEEEEIHAAPAWVKELRKSQRELRRENAELQAQLQAKATETKPVDLGAKPTLEGCDFDGDRFERELTAWHDRKRQVDQETNRKAEEQHKVGEAWQATLDTYGRLKAELKVRDFADAEMEVENVLSQTQRGIILQGAENPAVMIYALGKNPAKAKDLAAITDPVKYAFAIAKLEATLKVTPRKPSTHPERTITGSAPISGTVDSNLERLRAEAEKTGDYTKVHQYKRSLRNK